MIAIFLKTVLRSSSSHYFMFNIIKYQLVRLTQSVATKYSSQTVAFSVLAIRVRFTAGSYSFVLKSYDHDTLI